jgi:hypothetical protein
MPSSSKRKEVTKFPLRLMPSVRRHAEAFSEKEGVSLNQFINVAVAEKLAHLEHEDWVRSRRKLSAEMIARGLEILDQGRLTPESEDRLPKGYRSPSQPGR